MSSTSTITNRTSAPEAVTSPAASTEHGPVDSTGTRATTTKKTKTDIRIKTFAAFYKFYLSEHSHRTNRRLHIVGTTNAAVLIVAAALRRQPKLLLAALLQGYAFAWVGHFFFEKNKPATFKYPLWSFISDWIMWYETVTLKRPF
ncbi:hypothetical protein BCR44DRAFT_355285 [Catenaria anguillulae PL171]|uniref:DUF962 domain-containing protein n=1 Tax=Catenaria anguillulae PL171 TaxID=765915 RepID=A0A1Y2I244_9FUNG|nr:hypothetical protein BCR44DRAFT_355285 [Catenaria anguillulae PL171]